MSNSKLKNQIMDKICANAIKPKSKTNFILKESVIWIICLLTLIVGSLATSVIIFLIQNNDWDIYTNLNDNILEFTILTIPYLWIIILVFLISILSKGINHTNKCYKINPVTLLSVTIALSSIFGSILFYQGVGYQIDSTLNSTSPIFHKLLNHNARTWSQPELGFLAGQIHKLNSNQEFNVIDLNKKDWFIVVKNKHATTTYRLKIGQRVRLIGKPNNDNTFIASKIMPTKIKGCPLVSNATSKTESRHCPIHKQIIIERK